MEIRFQEATRLVGPGLNELPVLRTVRLICWVRSGSGRPVPMHSAKHGNFDKISSVLACPAGEALVWRGFSLVQCGFCVARCRFGLVWSGGGGCSVVHFKCG